MQEIGRAGRNGQPSVSLLYFNDSDIACNVTGFSDCMREYCTTDECLRRCLLKEFGFDVPVQQLEKCKCCINCKQLCECKECDASD